MDGAAVHGKTAVMNIVTMKAHIVNRGLLTSLLVLMEPGRLHQALVIALTAQVPPVVPQIIFSPETGT